MTRQTEVSIHNADIAKIFAEIADRLEIQGENPFRVRAYRNAARTVVEMRLDLAKTIREGEPLPRIPGIGEDLGRKLREIAETGTAALLVRLRKQLPPDAVPLERDRLQQVDAVQLGLALGLGKLCGKFDRQLRARRR